MEPMTLSPSSPVKAQYLPSFLLGEATNESITSNLDSSNLMRSSRGPMNPANTSRYDPNSSQLTSPASIYQLHHTPDYNRGSKAKLDGPPTLGLFDDITNLTMSGTSPQEKSFNRSNNVTNMMSPNDSSRLQNDSVWDNTENTDTNNGFWVVVFGFPQSHLAQVLAIFTQLGRVMEHSFPSNGNWLYVKYESRVEVRKAIAHNERIICGNIMIGVSERRGQPTLKDKVSTNGVQSPTVRLTPKSPNLRNLTTSRRENAVVDNFVTPTKDTSVVSKAMDLLFGW